MPLAECRHVILHATKPAHSEAKDGRGLLVDLEVITGLAEQAKFLMDMHQQRVDGLANEMQLVHGLLGKLKCKQEQVGLPLGLLAVDEADAPHTVARVKLKCRIVKFDR